MNFIKKKTSSYIFGYGIERGIKIWIFFILKIIIMAIENLSKPLILALVIFLIQHLTIYSQ
jgi:hypothetical protein